MDSYLPDPTRMWQRQGNSFINNTHNNNKYGENTFNDNNNTFSTKTLCSNLFPANDDNLGFGSLGGHLRSIR